MKFLHEISIKLLDLVYILHEEIFTKLLLVATGETYRSVNHRHKLAVLASDFMLLASAVIAAAAFILDEQSSDGVCLESVGDFGVSRMKGFCRWRFWGRSRAKKVLVGCKRHH